MKKFSDEKKCVICFALVILMGLLLFYTYAGDGNNNHAGIIRLHIIANSDSIGDQSLKLKVRDAVIEHMQKQDDISTDEDVRNYITANLDRFEAIADGITASEGYDYHSDADLGVRYIPEKTYGDITFPAGNYETLNITLGKGEGANWWCVVFPPLCLLEEGTENAGSTESPSDIRENGASPYGGEKTGDNLTEEERLQLRWKLIEILQE